MRKHGRISERSSGQGKKPRRISRRQFLTEATLAGAVIALPTWLTGCGDDGTSPSSPTPSPTPTPVPRLRERRTLHFDFSFGNLRDVRLIAANSESYGAPIIEHTAASRARAREGNAALVDVPDENLTHFIEDVDLPADALQLLMARGVDADSGEPALAALYLHVPAISTASNLSGDARTIDDLVINVKGFVTPWDTAVALVFHSAEIMNLNLDQGGTILAMINALPCDPSETNCTAVPFLATLASVIANNWPATTSGGWATLVQVTDLNGKPLVDGEGNPAYRYDLNPEVRQTVVSVAAQIKASIFNDAQFEGTNWHPTEGMTVSETTATGAAAAASFAVTAAQPPGTHVHGVKFAAVDVIDAVNRTVQVKFRNDYLRYLSTYVQFANEAGNLPFTPSGRDTERAKFLAWINSNYTVLGIPLIGNDVALSSVQFDVPTDASIAKIYFGSLGLGGEAFSPEALDGAILTLFFNIGLPSILLVAGVAVSATLLKSLTKQLSSTLVQIMTRMLPLIIAAAGPGLANGIFGTANSKSAVGVLTSLGNAVISGFFATGEGGAVLVDLGLEAATGSIVDACGPVGIAFWIIAAASDLATIAESVGEVLANPPIFINELNLSQTTTVTINRDPRDFEFPAEARHYEVTLTYDSASKVAHKLTGTIEPGRSDPIVATFEGVPSGGMVTVDIYLTTGTGCIVGRSTDANGNFGPSGPWPGTQTQIDVTIKEKVIPLTQTTQYLHGQKLEYQDGKHIWVQTTAPTATIAALNQGNDDALYDVTGITLSQRAGMAGYAYLAGGQGVPFCGQSTSGIMHMLQNVFLGEDPDQALKQLPCGFQQTAGIVYEKLGSPTGRRNFFLQPAQLGFLLQSVAVDDTTPFDVANPLTWGVFTEALDSLAVVPTGYVVGVDRQNHKMQILELPATPQNPSTAPQAVPFSVSKMGPGTRIGLLLAPVAVTVFDAAILILEAGNQRIQAVDVSGNPVPRFQNGTTNIIQLERGSSITYLDLGVEGMGYLYVLSYVNDGRVAADYRLDVYDPQGNFLTRTTGVAAARLAVDTFRNVYTLNYETVAGAPRVEPSLSKWNPSTPAGCPTPPAA